MRSLAHPVNSLAVLAADPAQEDPSTAKAAGSPRGSSPQRGAGAAWLMAGSMLLGAGLGYLLDHHYATSPRWTVALSMVFLAVGMYQTIREANR